MEDSNGYHSVFDEINSKLIDVATFDMRFAYFTSVSTCRLQFTSHSVIYCGHCAVEKYTYSLIAEYSKMKVGMTSSMSANALTAGSQNVSIVQIAAVTPKIALNIFLNERKKCIK